ncbi:MAG: permease-like cell division protein FtsX [bacterium]|nr:permease-like cell division protein FtsX [bacterium]
MLSIPLAIRLGFGLLRSRPTLTILAVGLTALAAAVLGGLFGTVYLLRSLQAEFMTALTVEIELAHDTDAARARVMSEAENWPGAEFVQYVSADNVLREVEAETGENLAPLFGGNPFPAFVRVRFGHAELATLDSLARAAEALPEVLRVVYPRTLWTDLERLALRVRGSFGWIGGLIALLALGLIGFSLRAQVRNLRATWEFLALLGLSQRILGVTLLVQRLTVGALGGLLACGALALLAAAYSLFLLRPISFPFWFHITVWLTALALAAVAGMLTTRRIPAK